MVDVDGGKVQGLEPLEHGGIRLWTTAGDPGRLVPGDAGSVPDDRYRGRTRDKLRGIRREGCRGRAWKRSYKDGVDRSQEEQRRNHAGDEQANH